MTEAPWKGKLRVVEHQNALYALAWVVDENGDTVLDDIPKPIARALCDAANSGGEGGRVVELEGALDRIMTGGNHLALHIGTDHPPHTASFDEALEHYGSGIYYDIWCCWKNIMDARALLNKEQAVSGGE